MTGAATPGQPVLEHFVVRVYRRSAEPGCELSGVVERVPGGASGPFRGRDELWSRLLAGDRPRTRRRKKDEA